MPEIWLSLDVLRTQHPDMFPRSLTSTCKRSETLMVERVSLVVSSKLTKSYMCVCIKVHTCDLAEL